MGSDNVFIVAKQRVPSDSIILKYIQSYLMNVNLMLENEIFGPAEKLKITLNHVLLVSATTHSSVSVTG